MWARTPVKIGQEERLMAELATDPKILIENSPERNAFLYMNTIIFGKKREDCSIRILLIEKEATLTKELGEFGCPINPKTQLSLKMPDENADSVEIIFSPVGEEWSQTT